MIFSIHCIAEAAHLAIFVQNGMIPKELAVCKLGRVYLLTHTHKAVTGRVKAKKLLSHRRQSNYRCGELQIEEIMIKLAKGTCTSVALFMKHSEADMMLLKPWEWNNCWRHIRSPTFYTFGPGTAHYCGKKNRSYDWDRWLPLSLSKQLLLQHITYQGKKVGIISVWIVFAIFGPFLFVPFKWICISFLS